MPIYEYRCASCGFQKEYLRKVSDPLLSSCPDCGKESFQKMLTAAGFQLKGSGWYATDFKHNGTKPKKEEAPSADASKSDAATSDASKTDASKSDSPKSDSSKTDSPKTDSPKTGAPKTGAPASGAGASSAPTAAGGS